MTLNITTTKVVETILTVNHSHLQNYTHPDYHIQYTNTSKVVTWGFLQAPMTMAECVIILNRLQIIGERFLCGSGVVGLESGGPSACPVFVLSALKSLGRSKNTFIIEDNRELKIEVWSFYCKRQTAVCGYPSAYIWDLRLVGGSSRLPCLFSFIHLLLF